MTATDDSGTDWDEVVDVICVGTGPGVLAYAICCAAADLDVLFVRPPAVPDQQATAWCTAMTEDLGGTPASRPSFSFARLAPAPAPAGKRVVLEPFVGEHLRQWSAQCIRSAFGVMFTQVPDLLLPMRTDDGRCVTAAFLAEFSAGEDLESWLGDIAAEMGLSAPECAMTAMIPVDGRIAGVQVDDGARIAATGGLVLPVDGAERPDAILPSAAPGVLTVGVLGRPAGRFAMVDVVRR
jgi:hypothetical protein